LAGWDDRLLRLLTPRHLWSLLPVWRYGLAVVFVVVATSLRWELLPWLGTALPYCIGGPAIVITTILFGSGPGLVFVVLDAMAVEVFISGALPMGFAGTTLVRSGIAIAAGVFMVCVLHALRAAVAKAGNSEDRFHTAFAQGSIGMTIATLDGHIWHANAAFCRMLGYTETELETQSFFAMTHPDDLPANRSGIQQIITGETASFRMEKRYLHKDGHLVWGEMSTVVVRDSAGIPSYLITHVLDITPRKQSEQMMARYQLIMQHARDPLLLSDIDGHIIECNQAAEAFYGYPRAALRQLRIFDLRCADDRETIRRQMQQARTGGILFETMHRRKDGSVVPVEVSSQGVIVEGQELLLSMIRDISERQQAEEALRESERRLAHAEDIAKLGYWEWNLRTDTLHWSRGLYRITGVAETVTPSGALVDSLIHPDDRGTFHTVIAQAMQEGLLPGFDLRGISANGVEGYVHLQGEVIHDAAGQACGLFGTVQDITKRKQAEETCETMLAVLRLLNAADDLPALITKLCQFFQRWSGCEAVGIRLRDGDDFPYYVSRGFPRTFILAENSLCGHSPDGQCARDTIGNPLLECMCGHVLSGRFDPAQPFFTTYGSFWSNATSVLLANTTEADRHACTRNTCNRAGYESVALIPLRLGQETFGLLQLNDKRPGRFSVERIELAEWLCQHIAIALSQRKTAQELERERAFLAAAIDLLPLPLTFLNHHQQEILMNRAAQERLTALDINSRQESQLLDPRTKALIPRHDWPSIRALHGEVVIAEELLLAIPSTEEEIPCLFYAAPVIVEGQNIAAGVVLQDITALKETDRAKDEFLAVLSHELQTPLTSMLGWSAEALRDGSPEMMAHAMGIVHRNALRQQRLVEEMLDMSRLIHRKIGLTLEETDLWTQTEQAVENVRHVAAERKLRLRLVAQTAPLPIRVDPVRLQQCIGNLLHNSLKFTPENGTITVACRRDHEQALFTVTDTGRGIDPAALPTLFAVFRQVERNEQHGGLGLGLAVTRGIIELHGGTITAESPGRNRGSTFTIALPLAVANAGESLPAQVEETHHGVYDPDCRRQ